MKKKTRRKRISEDYEEDFDGVNPRDLEVVKDHGLPSPSEIAKSLQNARITILLDGALIQFFKKEAVANGVGYQQLIRQVLREYMRHHRRAA